MGLIFVLAHKRLENENHPSNPWLQTEWYKNANEAAAEFIAITGCELTRSQITWKLQHEGAVIEHFDGRQWRLRTEYNKKVAIGI